MVDFAKLGNLIWNPLFLWIVSFDAEVLRENIYLSPIIEGQKKSKKSLMPGYMGLFDIRCI